MLSPSLNVLSALCLLLSASSYSLSANAHQVAPIEGLLTPESVIQAKDGKIYVSEINGFGVDGDGQIRVIDHGNSSVLVSGLNDPKGLMLVGSTLYIADKTQILKVDVTQHTPKAEVFVAASAFPTPPQFLNDLAVDGAGNLYVSDSGDILGSGRGGAVYLVSKQGNVNLVMDGKQDARILCPNGLWVDDAGKQLLIVDFTSGVLFALNLAERQLTEIAQGFGGGDGLVKTQDQMLYVSDWKSGSVFSVTPQGIVTRIQSGYQASADIALSLDGKHLLIPDMKAGQLLTLPLHH